MKLYDATRLYADELRSDMAYMVFYKESRSWEAECLWALNPETDYVDEEEVARLVEIESVDPNATIIDTYDCPWFYDEETLKDLYEAVKCCVSNDYFSVGNFLEHLES